MTTTKDIKDLFQTSNLTLLISYTVFAVILMAESLLMGWETWAVCLILVSVIICWVMHIRHNTSEEIRIWTTAGLMMVFFFFLIIILLAYVLYPIISVRTFKTNNVI